MSHRQTQRATHRLTATRSGGTATCDVDADCPEGSECVDGVCVDPLSGEPIDGDDETVLDAVPVRFRSGGTEFVRAETGERVERSDTVTGGRELLVIEEGDSIDLDALDNGREAIENVEVRGVEPHEGRHGRVSSVTIELEDV